MIPSPQLKSNVISFQAEKKPIAGASMQPQNTSPGASDPHAAKEHIVRLNPIQKFNIGAKKVLVDIPSSIVHGLQGDRKVSFHDLLQMAAVPYYLGGAMLYSCFRAGGDIKTAKKQGVGVGLYYLGMGLGNNFVDSFVKHKYGIDINLAYRNIEGKLHKVFESNDFTRWDLLTEKDWNEMGDKLGIPRDLPDRDTAIKTEVSKILVKARAWKLVLGATFAGVGAGFLARNKAWEGLFSNAGAVKTSLGNVFKGNGKPLGERLGQFANTAFGAFKSEVIQPLGKALKELPSTKLGNFPVGKIAAGALIALPLMALYSLITTPNKKKAYVSKDEAMPYASVVENDQELRRKIISTINPNKVDYESIYNQFAKQVSTPVIQPVVNRPLKPVTSPFDVFEMFIGGGNG